MRIFPVTLAMFCLTAGARFVSASDAIDAAYTKLQAVESSNSPSEIKEAALTAFHLADQEMSQPAPTDTDQKEAWAKQVAYDRTVEVHAEYALYTAAASAKPAEAADLLSTLQGLNPKSKYLELGYGYYFRVLEQTGQSGRVAAEAEKALKSFPNNADALLILADASFNRKQGSRALTYAQRLIAVSHSAKPESVSLSASEKSKNGTLCRGYWIAGIVEAQQNDFYHANTDLRSAIRLNPSDQMLEPALFYLGMSNYYLSREMLSKSQMREAIQFSEQAAHMGGPDSQQAFHNAETMKAELAKWR